MPKLLVEGKQAGQVAMQVYCQNSMALRLGFYRVFLPLLGETMRLGDKFIQSMPTKMVIEHPDKGTDAAYCGELHHGSRVRINGHLMFLTNCIFRILRSTSVGSETSQR